jgi:biopolymer transport protein ExbB
MKRLLPLLLLFLACSGMAHAGTWWNDKWILRKKITIDTTPTGGAVTDSIGTTPVLIRLSDFNFAAARDDGTDIRIVADDGKTSLPCQIEKYDSLLGEAFVWVSVPNLKPGATTTLYLYYGNQGDTTVEGDGHAKPVYDSDTVLVYHFSDKVGVPPADATANGNNAQNAGLSDDGSIIGSGLRLDGKTTVTLPASSSLGWAAGSSLTWSAWIKPAALAANTVVFSRRDGASDFLVGVDGGVPFVDINGTRSTPGAPIIANSWHHLAVVADSTKTTLYLDGAVYGSVAGPLPALNTAARLGADSPDATTGNAPFVGGMDELEISRVAPGRIASRRLVQRRLRPLRRHP